VKNKPNRPLSRLINHFNKDAPPLRYTTFDNISLFSESTPAAIAFRRSYSQAFASRSETLRYV
jgi:hypothetical protein